MTRSTNVVALSGSLADESVTRIAVDEALSAAETADARTTHLDLRTYDLPAFDADHQDAGDAPALRRRLRRADAGSAVSDGALADGPIRDRIRRLGTDLVAYADVPEIPAAIDGEPAQPAD